MTSVIQYTSCPACGSTDIHHVLDAKDHTVSKKTFAIWECSRCSLRFTQAVPDQQEIGAYYQSENYISHSNTKKGIVNQLYHLVRERSLNNKRKLIQSNSHTPGTPRLLDIGSGIGAFMHHMQQHGWHVEGIEPSAEARAQAAQQFKLAIHPPEYLFDPQLRSFDIITMWHVLEHVHTLQSYMVRLRELMQPNATLFIAVPNYTSWDASVYDTCWAAYDVPRHLYHFSPASMRMLLQKHGFTLKAIQPMWFDSFYVSMLSEKYKTGGSGLIKGGMVGLLSNLKAAANKERCSSLIYVIKK
jgi:2-polyprenyl-3-methyl-5-hydroxy-6-metoxy-1,4-benzoquinol methylase